MNDQQRAASEVVLLHGWGCPTGYWAPLQFELHRLGFHTAAPPLPGYGPEAPLPAGFDWNVESIADVIAHGAARRPAPVHWVGHSLGGSIAATVAARHPEVAASATLLGMVPTAPSDAIRERLSAMFPDGPISDESVQQCLTAWYGDPLPADDEMLRAPFDIRRTVLDASLLAALDGVAPDVPEKIDVPAQVIVGADDQTRPLSEVEEYVRSHPGIELTVVPESGHMVHWSSPAACADRIRSLVTGG